MKDTVAKVCGVLSAVKIYGPPTPQLPHRVDSPSVSSEPSADGHISAEGSETSSSDESSPIPTMTRTAACQLESHLLGSRVDEELGRTRATRAFNRETAGLVTMLGPDEGGKLIHGLLAVRKVTRKPGELRKYLVLEAGPEPISYPPKCSSEDLDVWIETMKMECDGLVAAGTFAEVTENS